MALSAVFKLHIKMQMIQEQNILFLVLIKDLIWQCFGDSTLSKDVHT